MNVSPDQAQDFEGWNGWEEEKWYYCNDKKKNQVRKNSAFDVFAV